MEASTYGATPQDVDVSRAGGLSSRSSTSRVFSGAVVATVAAVALITLVYMTNFGVYSMFGGAHVTDEPVTFVLHTCDIPDFVKEKSWEPYDFNSPVADAYIVRHNYQDGTSFEWDDALKMRRREGGEAGVFELTTNKVTFEWGFAIQNQAGRVLYEVGSKRSDASGCVGKSSDGRPCRKRAPMAKPKQCEMEHHEVVTSQDFSQCQSSCIVQMGEFFNRLVVRLPYRGPGVPPSAYTLETTHEFTFGTCGITTCHSLPSPLPLPSPPANSSSPPSDEDSDYSDSSGSEEPPPSPPPDPISPSPPPTLECESNWGNGWGVSHGPPGNRTFCMDPTGTSYTTSTTTASAYTYIPSSDITGLRCYDDDAHVLFICSNADDYDYEAATD